MVGKQTSRDCQGILDNEGARGMGGKFPLIPVDSLSKAVQITVMKGRGNSMDNLSLPRIYISRIEPVSAHGGFDRGKNK